LKVIEILGKVPTALSNDENHLFKHIDKKGKVSDEDLSDFWKRVAEQLCQKGLIHGKEANIKNGIKTIYRVAD
jgi:hypothetical protein